MAHLLRFETTILAQLENVGLPTEDVVVSLDEREMVLTNLGAALRRLPGENRARSLYVSKMIVAAAVGVFDAALNYLRDETVNELRRRVIGYDVKYFFDIAVVGDMQKAEAPQQRGRSSSRAGCLKTILGSLANLTQGVTELRN